MFTIRGQPQGHIFITVGLTVFLVNLGRAIKEPDEGIPKPR
ncbi:hypothetical protein [Corynebacterium macginleyi]|nr:hypothetical protein [Corynebacterium macginleyi]